MEEKPQSLLLGYFSILTLSRLTMCFVYWIGFPRGLMLGVVSWIGNMSTGKDVLLSQA